jgi:hypothetical protein
VWADAVANRMYIIAGPRAVNGDGNPVHRMVARISETPPVKTCWQRAIKVRESSKTQAMASAGRSGICSQSHFAEGRGSRLSLAAASRTGEVTELEAGCTSITVCEPSAPHCLAAVGGGHLKLYKKLS